MLYLLEFLDMIPPRIVGGDKYSWTCYGDNARYLDLEQNVDVVFDEQTQEVYEISIHNDDSDTSDTTWRNPQYESAYLEELKLQRDLDEEELKSKQSNVIHVDEMIGRVKNLYESGSIF